MGSYHSFTVRRTARRYNRNLRLWRQWSANYVNRHLFGAWQKLGKMRWTFVAWLVIVFISAWGLISQIQALNTVSATSIAQDGGVYHEGLLGEVKSVNPLFPENAATNDVSSLVFSGLTKINGKRDIVPDLADHWDISADKKTYTFYIRPNATWHDGSDVTAEDVAFTVSRVQNPDTRSPLASNWSGVKYQVVDPHTIKFTLPSSFTPFLSNTTLGILPHRQLESVKPANLRIFEFNQKPMGSGPYKLNLLEVDKSIISLQAYDKYYFGRPHIDRVQFYLYSSLDDMIDGMARHQIEGMGQLTAEKTASVSKLENVTVHQLSLPAYVGLFFNLKSPTLQDANFRKALAYSVNRDQIISDSLHGEAIRAYFPIPAGFVGYNPNATRYDYNFDQAQKTWAQSKYAQSPEKLRLVTLKSPEYEAVAKTVADQWAKLGVQVEVITADSIELQQNYIRSRNYDILLYGQSLGLDSDVYSFWHSSQADDPGLNVSSYKNGEADKFLETGRIAKDEAYKASRFSSFVDQWAKDIPAVILYSPYYNYAQFDSVHGFDAKKISEPSDRFYNIQNWYVRTTQVNR